MGKLRSVAGVFRTMLSMAREDWHAMDKKFYRLVFGAASFAAMALFWYFILRRIIPF